MVCIVTDFLALDKRGILINTLFLCKTICCGHSLELLHLGEVLLMSTHNICFCEEIGTYQYFLIETTTCRAVRSVAHRLSLYDTAEILFWINNELIKDILTSM